MATPYIEDGDQVVRANAGCWSLHYANTGRSGKGWHMVFCGDEQEAKRLFAGSPRSARPRLYDPEGKLADFIRPKHNQINQGMR